ncbi:VWA domain-containing protein [Corallococcus carmarthensis]|uniref:VWA domain-containing protein n=1 Tax=Corallococcus carmarthensis TaxID=2316728 RepID=UPI0013152A4D|nr:VWA domain-containing protein [Corallococcus carmarthensis]
MMTYKVMLRLLVVLGTFVMARPGTASAQQYEDHVILLLDRSASMALPAAGGLTRFQVAVQRAQAVVAAGGSTPRHYAVVSFNGASYIMHRGFTTNTTLIQVTLNSLQVGMESAPVAHAICGSVDELLAYRPQALARKRIALFLASEDTGTPTSSQCYGPASTTPYPTPTPGSWQYKVRNKLVSGDPNTVGNPQFPVVQDFDMLMPGPLE